MTIFYTILTVYIVIAAWFVLSLCWAARGEADVNGDPERDAGLIGVEQQLGPTGDYPCRVDCLWCHVVLRSSPGAARYGLCPSCLGEADREIEGINAKI